MKTQEAYRTPNRLDQKKKKSPCHIIIKTLNIQNKERIFLRKNIKNCKGKGQVTYKSRPIRITPDFSLETMKARRSWSSIMQTLRDSRCQPRLLCPAKLSITIEGQNKIFHDKTRFNHYLATKLGLHKVLEGKLQPKEVSCIHKNTVNR